MKARYQFRIGLTFVVAIVSMLFIIILLIANTSLFENKVNINIRATNGDGLSVGMPVKFSGFTIGNVYDIELFGAGNLTIKARVLKKYSNLLREDSSIKLVVTILGSQYLDISGGSPEKPEIKEGVIFALDESNGYNELLKKVIPVVENAQDIVANIKQVTDTLNDRNSSINKFVDGLGVIGNDIQKQNGALGYLLMNESVREMLNHTMHNIDNLSDVVAKGYGSPEFYKQVYGITANFNNITYDTSQALANYNSIIDDIRSNIISILKNLNSSSQQVDPLLIQVEKSLYELDLTLQKLRQSWILNDNKNGNQQYLMPDGSKSSVYPPSNTQSGGDNFMPSSNSNGGKK